MIIHIIQFHFVVPVTIQNYVNVMFFNVRRSHYLQILVLQDTLNWSGINYIWVGFILAWILKTLNFNQRFNN